MTQTTLNFDAADRAEIEATRPPTAAELFEQFDRENPDVYDAIKTRAVGLCLQGYKRWSIEEIWNWLRWHRQCKTTGKPYALNNNYKKPYVEKLVAECPQLQSFFVRKGRADGNETKEADANGGTVER